MHSVDKSTESFLQFPFAPSRNILNAYEYHSIAISKNKLRIKFKILKEAFPSIFVRWFVCYALLFAEILINFKSSSDTLKRKHKKAFRE